MFKNQDTNFICAEACDNDHVCHVCFQPLVGPVLHFRDGCHTVHEGCMFKLWLFGYTSVYIIREKNDLNIKLDINYPTTLYTKIRDNLIKFQPMIKLI